MKKVLFIDGMHCEHCAEKVSTGLASLDGVNNVKVILKKKKAIVDINKNIDDSEFTKKIEELGFELQEVKNKKFL